MSKFIKFALFFFLNGIIWFFLFSIPILGKENNLFIILSSALKSASYKTQNSSTKEINPKQVIDAITNAFK